MKIRRKTKTAGRAKNFSLPAGAVDLTKMLKTLKPHDHLCLIYESHKEWRAAVVPFISIGLRRGEKCAYIIDTSTADEIRKYLREEGVDVASAEKSGQLFILPEAEAYTREDSFDPDRMIALLISETEKAIAEGYPAFRVTAEMSWVLRGHLGSEKLLEYEAKLNRDLFPKYPCLAICQYDRWKFDPEIIKGVIMTHPLLVRSNNIYHNIYYIPPEEFLTQKRADAEVQDWLNNIEHEQQVQETLRESHERYSQLANSITDVFFAFDKDLKYTYWNAASEKLTKISAEEAIGKSLYDLFPDTPQTRIAEKKYREVLKTGISQTFVNEYKIGGKDYYFEISAYPSRDGISVFTKDITERKRAEEALRESEAKYSTVVEAAIDGIAIVQDGLIKFANKALEKMSGYNHQEIIDKPLVDFLHLADGEKALQRIAERIEGKPISGAFEVRYLSKNGMLNYLEAQGNVIQYNAKPADLVFIRDITDRKKAEEALRESEKRFHLLFENMTEGVALHEIIYDDRGQAVDYRILTVNPAYQKHTGLDPERAQGQLASVLYGTGSPPYITEYERVARTGEPFAFETYFPPMEKHFHIGVISPKRGFFATVFEDITERKRAEEALRESEERFRTLYENSTLGLYRTTPDGRILLANPTLVRMLGYSSFDDLSTRDLEKNGFEPSYPRAQFVEIIEKEGEVRGFESAWKRRDGTAIFVRESARAIRDPQGKTLYYDGTVEDITERKRAEEALRKSEEKYRNLVESISDVIYAIDGGGTITYVSPVVKNTFGYEPDELIGRPFIELVYKEDQSILTNRFLDLQRGIIKYAEYRMIDKQGDIKWVRTLSNPLIERGVFVGARGTLIDISERKRAEEALQRSEENFRRSLDDSPLGVRIVTVEGETVYANRAILDIYGYDSIEELRTTPLKRRYTPESYAEQQIRMEKRNRGEYDPSEYEIGIIRKKGEVRHLQVFRKEVLWNGERQFQVIYRDITEQKKAEEKIAASLMEKEVLLREIHHRVKNNMQIISSLLRLQSRSIEDEKMREIFNESQSRIRSMSLIHEKLYESKDFSRIDFSDYIGKMVTHLFVVYRVNTADVRFKVEAKGIYLDITKAIPCGLVINELVSNALKYAFAEGKKGDLIIRMNKDKNGKYHLSVKDTGIGVSPDFDIRKTETLGFQIVNDLVRQISGTIELKRDKGTEFRIVF